MFGTKTGATLLAALNEAVPEAAQPYEPGRAEGPFDIGTACLPLRSLGSSF